MPEKQDQPNVFRVDEEEKVEETRRFHPGDLNPGDIKQRHILDGKITAHGLAVDRPNGKTHIRQYFATDSGVLSIWNGDAWLSVTLT